ncbi:NAD-dependent epimerase/dehydratase family protein [Pararhodobacter zhoushanensis]|uniref:NAD(P)-dependent oxidoreductase n=1 Tax=Pararhodobacter zhoushanensis TaxID=2479545 RepID=A0ABT3H2F8_9RHOB|nr:NAD(P)-dependent oxidoreductase [Pararhodobacter zhoushanensis]MCW1933883.1 NAD(P)-dependent oxidoreductase [Pararhodobacter zhoushanensis]
MSAATGPVLITGAGLIGSQTARLLSARGQPCTLFDTRPPAAEIGALPGVRFVTGDLTDRAALEALFAATRFTGVVHTAAMLSNGLRADPVRGLEVNILGTTHLLQLAAAQGVRRFVQASSATVVYAGFDRAPAGPMTEDCALSLISQRPRSLYALSKLTCEHLALHWREAFGLSTVSLRFAAVLGGEAAVPSSVPGQLMNRLIAAARQGGTHALDDPLFLWDGEEEFVDLRDCARAMVSALDAPALAQGVYAIAGPSGHTLADVAACVAAQCGAFTLDVPPHAPVGFAGFPHPRPARSDQSAARRELGFTARHRLEDTLRHWWPQTERHAL